MPTLVNELGVIMNVPWVPEYPVQIPGAAAAPIAGTKITAVINWIPQEFNTDTLPKKFSPLSEDEVCRVGKHIYLLTR